jgi:osmotically-inducible protein OsmY
MKNIQSMFCYLVLFLLITAFAGCAATSTRGSTGDYIDDTVITTKVKALLAEDDFLKSFKISVETYKGTVQLSGFVNSQQAVNRAVEITRSVQGVKAVKNDLIVK